MSACKDLWAASCVLSSDREFHSTNSQFWRKNLGVWHCRVGVRGALSQHSSASPGLHSVSAELATLLAPAPPPAGPGRSEEGLAGQEVHSLVGGWGGRLEYKKDSKTYLAMYSFFESCISNSKFQENNQSCSHPHHLLSHSNDKK